MGNELTRNRPPPHAFPSTCWQLIGDARGLEGKSASLDALQEFCVSYWYPLYAWARQTGMTEHDAQDLIQGFFARLIEKDFLGAAEERKGKLRSFLIVCLKRHANDLRAKEFAIKRDVRKNLSLDFEWAEGRFDSHRDPSASPDEIYDRRWAHALLQYALGRLEEQMIESGRGESFTHLRPYLEFRADEEESYAVIGKSLGITESAVKSRINRLRKDYRRALLDQIKNTISENEDPKEELMALLGAV